MKFRVEREVLADGVAWAARALPNRPSIPTLAGVLITAEDSSVALSGFDMENAARVAVDAVVDEPGQVLVSGRLLADIARALPAEPVSIATEGSRVEVVCGRSHFVLPTLPVEDYPRLPDMPDVLGTVSGDQFAAAVGQVAIAAGKDDTLPMLLGVRIEFNDDRVTLAATDRYRLAVREFTWTPTATSTEGAALVPARVLADTAKLLADAPAVSIAYAPGSTTDGIIGFEGNDRRTTARLLDGDFPKYRQLLPESANSVATVDKAVLTEAVKRVALVAERNTPVRLKFSDGEVALQAGAFDEAQATESLECSLDGDAIEIAFNPNYLLDGIGAVSGSAVHMSFTDRVRAAVLTGSGSDLPDYKYLLMPVRLTS